MQPDRHSGALLDEMLLSSTTSGQVRIQVVLVRCARQQADHQESGSVPSIFAYFFGNAKSKAARPTAGTKQRKDKPSEFLTPK